MMKLPILDPKLTVLSPPEANEVFHSYSKGLCPQCKKAIPPHKVCELVEECGNIQRSKTHNPMAKEKA